ncbi:TrkH family potassium uptake protein [Terrihabitans sp. B22-R8]|uniref:TrkH family potassium uptake protein n=1 Tax=Terrihabitans sp. B22-R8 TaxID=3425128 RepID=UPI00403D01E6
MIDFRPVLRILGAFITLLGLLMLLPAAADLFAGSNDWRVFAASSGLSVFLGFALYTSARTGEKTTLSIRQTFLVTVLSWIVLAGFAALPFMWGEIDLSFSAAYFEAMSGLTTTGGTVLAGLDDMPPGLLLWRAVMHFYGGIGIVVMAIAVLPMLRVGGMQMFRSESSDRSEKIFPGAAQIAGSIFGVYLTLNLLCAVAYMIAGMEPFDALLHGMSTVAAGGFSSYDKSLGYFQNPAIEWVAVVFMLAACLPFVLYVHAVRGRPGRLIHSSEVRTFFGIVAGATAALWLYLVTQDIQEPGLALRNAAFHVASVISTTGLATQDYSDWGAFADVTFFLLMFVGGCTGSPAGGIKILRLLIMSKAVTQQLRRMLYPSGVFPIVFQGHPVPDDVVRSVATFTIVYLVAFALISLGLSATGLDFRTALSAGAGNLSNAGPGLGPIVGPVGNYSSLTPPALWLLSFAMLIGRLEIFTVLVLFLPRFWRP